MEFEFVTLDVFTARRFGGNQLAVLPDARGLSGEQMQAIAAEFNYAESTFVLPPRDPSHSANVRIFTPAGEMPFAGHPNVGTTFVLAELGRLHSDGGEGGHGTFEEIAGLVEVRSSVRDGVRTATIRAPRGLDRSEPVAPEIAAAAIGLPASQLRGHAPVYAESGVGFLLVEVANVDVLASAQVDPQRLREVLPDGVGTGVYAFTREGQSSGYDARARMYAPFVGVSEDAATGSAACVLAAVLTMEAGAEGHHTFQFEQGVEMGRPSSLDVEVICVDGLVDAIFLSGPCVPVMTGTLTI